MIPNKERQTSFRQRMAEQGLVEVRGWVPKDKASQAKSYLYLLRVLYEEPSRTVKDEKR